MKKNQKREEKKRKERGICFSFVIFHCCVERVNGATKYPKISFGSAAFRFWV
jgi:hypothetical protein